MQNLDLEKLKEKQKKIENQRRAIALKIRKAEEEEKRGRFVKAGQDLAEHYKKDPECKDCEKIAAICSKYFFIPQNEEESSTRPQTPKK